MDPGQVVPGHQMPDENYIERLFPKCPPKANSNQNSNQEGSNKGYSGKNGRRQVRTKVQQHSRRELEARRNKQLNSGRKNNNSNNSSYNNLGHNNHSSDSSDNDNGGGRLKLKRGSSGSQYGGGSRGFNNQQQQQQQPVGRRVGKYAASQSLLQQLERSQSAYSNLNNATSNNNDKSSQNQAGDRSKATGNTTNNQPQAQQTRVSGIVKSNSSFAFIDEASSSPICYPQQAAPLTNVHGIKFGSKEIDNHQSDHLFDNEPAGSELASRPLGLRPQVRPRVSFDTEESFGNDAIAAEQSMDGTSNLVPDALNNLVSKIDRRNNLQRQLFEERQQDEIDGCDKTDKGSESHVVRAIGNTAALQQQQLSPEAATSNATTTTSMVQQTADLLEFRHNKSAVNGEFTSPWANKISHNSPPSNQANSIDEPQSILNDDNLVAGRTNDSPEAGDKSLGGNKGNGFTTGDLLIASNSKREQQGDNNTGSLLEGHDINKNNISSNNDDNLDEANIVKTKADDDKYINLFVYDSATNQTLNRAQIPTEKGATLSNNNNQRQKPHNRNHKTTRGSGNKRGGGQNKQQGVGANPVTRFEEKIEIDLVQQEQNGDYLDANTIETDRNLISDVRALKEDSSATTNSHIDVNKPNLLEPEKVSQQQTEDRINIVSVYHRESEQLLATDLNDEENTVRNDASIDELCNLGDSLEQVSNDSAINRSSVKDSGKSIPATSSKLLNHRTSSSSSLILATCNQLQTVDERAEINIESDLNITGEEVSLSRLSDETKDSYQEQPISDTMPAANVPKKAFVPPGYPQRIRPQPNDTVEAPSTCIAVDRYQPTIQPATSETTHRSPINLNSNPLEKPSNIVIPITTPSFSTLDEQRSIQAQESNTGIHHGSKPENGPRVKFVDDENLVSVRDDEIQLNMAESDHFSTANPTTSQPILRRNNPNQHDLNTQVSKGNGNNNLQVTGDETRKTNIEQDDLTETLNKLSLSDNSSNYNLYNNESNVNLMGVGYAHNQTDIFTPAPLPEIGAQKPEQAIRHGSNMIDSRELQPMEPQMLLPTLRHHKLPNETSHYSVVRANPVLDTSAQVDNQAPPRSSSIQFNTLSDNESGPDELSPSSTRLQAQRAVRSYATNLPALATTATSSIVTAAAAPQIKKSCDSPNRNGSSSSSSSNSSSSTTQMSNKNNNNFTDDDLTPTTKTALIFPRLDEGLSSEAESNEEEIDDEDERAMDADVDADDDEDDESDDDDEDEDDEDEDLEDDGSGATLQPLGPARSQHQQTIQLGQSSASNNPVDCYLRQQQQPLDSRKPPNRAISSLQQHQQPSALSLMDQSELQHQQVKAPGSAYGPYAINQQQHEPLEHDDLKSMTSYPHQNGQANYWMGLGSNQQQPPTQHQQQPSSSQHFNQVQASRNLNNMTTSASKGNPINSYNCNDNNKDEVKATNRLSSDTDNETDRLLGTQRSDQLKSLANNNDSVINVNNSSSADLHQVSNVVTKQNSNSKEVLIEGVLFNVKYVGSTHSDCEGRSEKEDRIHQAEMAVQEVKFRNDNTQPATEVQLFISTEKIMVLDDKHRKIMMDHSLRTISYIADIGEAIVLIVRKKNNPNEMTNELGRPINKISCHVFESKESHTITKSISQAFQVAYTELLKANGTGDTSSYLPKEVDYQEVLNSQEMSTDELEMFARKENQREVIVPKEKGEILGLSIVESGWGSVLPTVVIANLKHDGPAHRCKRLSIGDQILSINGISLVGLPLAECQEILRKTKNQRVARLSVVPCPITVEVKIKRPDTKYQLGFSVQNGVICSLLRGGIAERGGVRVGHRIMSINGTTVVGVPHEKIVTLLASSVGEIRMKTCLTSLYRLILGEENPVHF